MIAIASSKTLTPTGSNMKDLVVKLDPDPPRTGDTLYVTITGELGM